MINRQLVDFIKQQLQAGATREKISSDLLANGWNAQDIEEGFNATSIPIPPAPAPTLNPTPVTTQNLNPILSSYSNNNNPVEIKVKKQSGKKIFFIILIILVLLAGGASAYYFRDSLLNLPVIKNIFSNLNKNILDNIPETNTIPQPEVPVPTPTPTSPTSDTSTTPVPPIPTPTPTPAPATQPDNTTTNTTLSNSARDSLAKKDLKKAAVVAEIYYNKAESYSGFCTSSEYANSMKDVVAPTVLNCKDSTDEYSITASISSGGYWCVDNYLYNNKASLNIGTTCVK